MIPTILTVLRLLLSFIIITLLFVDGQPARFCALVLFLFAGFTDWLDGFLARRLGQTSGFGAVLDPIADKVLVLGILSALAQLGVLPAWMVLLIAAREIVVTAIRLLALRQCLVLSAETEGKQKTAAQMVTILLALAALLAGAPGAPQMSLGHLLWWIARLSLWIALTLTLLSGALFFWRHWTVVRKVFAYH